MNMKKISVLFTTLGVCILATLSCTKSENIIGGEWEPDDDQEIVNLVKEPKPVVLTSEQRIFANDNNRFTLNFLKTVSKADVSGKSFIYSPLSITYVLGMVNDAAVGDTEQELEQTLGFHQGGIKAVNEYCKNLIDNLPLADAGVTLNIANAIFLNKNYTLKEQFQQDMKKYYDAKAEAMDFLSPSTLSTINGWCNQKTKGMIPKILDEVKPDFVSYLLNAIYFKADWTTKFNPKNTQDEDFTTARGTKKLPMMHQNVEIMYVKNDTFAAVTIPYGNGLWSMAVMLPEEGKTTDDVIDLLAAKGWSADETADPMAEAREYEVDLKLPRYETASDTEDITDGLKGLLQKMGIRLAFDSYFAQIPNMCEVPVYISLMRQKAKIKVNEEGSEAAAVTVAGMNKCTSVGPMEPRRAVFHANRPFVYVIREASSGVILFVGKFTGE